MKKRINITIFLSTILLMISFLNVFIFATSNLTSVAITRNTTDIGTFRNTTEVASNVGKRIYLSDIDYITTNGWSYNGWSGHNIEYDKTQESSKLSLQVDGKRTYFAKGLSIHAKGQVVYDITELSTKYPRFVAYLGVDAARGNKGDLWIQVSVSNDGISWQELYKTDRMNGQTPAIYVDLSVEGYKYLKIYVDPNGGNGADHATIATASLVTKDYDKAAPYYNKLHTVDYYDSILKNYSVEENYTSNYRLVLERELVNKLGYSTIQEFAELNPKAIKTLDWYLAKDERIEQIIEVGEISNTSKFLEILADIYTEYETEFNSTDRLIYVKMAVGLGATYVTDAHHSPLRFSGFASTYDYVERYTLMKKLFDEDKFMHIENNTRDGNFIPNTWFEGLHVELIRMIMHDNIFPEEIIWLNEYTHINNTLNEFRIPYIHPNYNQAKLFDEANRDTYNSKYLLNQYGIPYADGKQRLWMVLEAGGICWNQSRFGQTMYRVNGIPAIGAYQPGHEMYFSYAEDDNGNGYWMERYGNYNNAGTTWYGGNRYRLIFNWGAKSFTEQNINDTQSGTSLGYLYLAQANLNNYDDYKKSLYYNLIANSYEDNNQKIAAYFKALEVNSINLDSYDNLINLYKKMSVKNGGTITSNDWYNLALKVTESYKYYPVAMYDLLKVIRPYLENEKKLDIDAIEKKYLTEATTVSDATLASIGAVNAGSGVRTHAKRLLGLAQPDPVTFSFDGEDSGKLVKNPIYSVNWAYSLDGGITYSNYSNEDYVTLTKEEIASINKENDIKIIFMGIKDYIFTIDITEGVLPADIYPNDLENSVIAATDNMEWRIQGTEKWTTFGEEKPDLTGDKTIEVRIKATGTRVHSATTVYTFTNDNQPATAKYIPIEHLSIHSYSTQSKDSGRPFYAPNAIDGNIYTLWHTDFALDVRNDKTYPFLVIELDEPRNISALEFIQRRYKTNNPDFIKDAIIYVSTDGEDWVEAGRIENCPQRNELRRINFAQSVYGKYVKIEMKTYDMFASLAMVNLFEDTTIKTIGTFSFDGNHAGEIVLVDEFKGHSWEYSLDGGVTWKQVQADEKQLTSAELQEINAEDNIKLRIVSENIETAIDIRKQEIPAMPSTLYLNDLENRLIGLTNIEKLEWKIDNSRWTLYKDEEPIVTGTRKLYIRNKAYGNILASDYIEYQFTADNQPNTAKYIPIKHLTIHDFSSETVRPGNQEQATKAIDGNIYTKWHSSRTAFNDEKYISIKLDEPRYISKIQYNKEAGYIYGVPKDGVVYVSMDGENWQKVKEFKNLYNPSTKAELQNAETQKDIVLDESVLAQYIKIQVITSCDYLNGSNNGVPYNYFFSSTMLNFFEDTTKNAHVAPTAEIEYSTTSPTNLDVEVRLVNPSKDITITNNKGSDKYVFSENGSFTFEFVDAAGNIGTAEAIVDWIDKTPIKADIAYNINTKTNQNVTATIAFNKENVNVTGGNTHVFTENGTYTFTYVDEAGNRGTADAIVNWIDRTPPKATITYNISTHTNQDVIATITFDEENVTVTDGNTHVFAENGTYTFEYVDAAGNRGTAISKVDWIDRTLPKATITYNTTSKTNQDVVATVTFDKENVLVTGGNTHTFTENGEYVFEFVGPAGNEGTAIAKVDWIDKKAPVATIRYNPPHHTNQNVIATITFDEENVTVTDGNTHTFTENGTYTFAYIDEAGNRGTTTAKVDWIDRTLPVSTITYSINKLTNQDVVATITFDKENVTVKGGNTHLFTENGEYEFEFVGPAGNEGTAIAKVDWIDKKKAIPTVTYSTINETNQDVVATVTFDKENVTVKGGNTHTFTENGEYIFEYVDAAGNVGTAVAIVSWIEKTAPTAKVEYSTTELTNHDVIAIVTFDKKVSFLNEGIYGEELSNNTYRFVIPKNVDAPLEFVDVHGNKGTIRIKVDWIDKEAPTAEIVYSQTTITTDDVIATLTTASEDITITNNNGSNKYTFKENGEFTFEFVDKAGNIGTATAKVTNIDKKAPVVEIKYSTTKLTNQDVTATIIANSEITITNNDGKDSYTFTENGEFTFEFTDKFGNNRTIKAVVNNIDKTAPTATIITDIVTPTNQNVTARLVRPNEEITITNNNGSSTYIFTENGEFTFEYVDKAGNIGTSTIKVTNIDKVAPTAEVEYSTTEVTTDPVTASIKPSEEVTITNNGGQTTYTFTENGEFTFEFVDKVGNIGTATAKVDWIKQKPTEAPILKVNYDKTTLTNEDVTATLELEEGIKVTNNAGKNTYTFTENGTFTFTYKDEYGNIGTAIARVDWIDKTIPQATLKYSTTAYTNQDVTVTLVSNEDITILTNNGSNTYKFIENGEIIFEFTDKAGNKNKIIAKVDWIDKVAPTAEVEYSTTEETTEPVTATIKPSEEVTITNNEGKLTYTFKENGEFTFEFIDKAGNKGSVTAKVDWIKSKPTEAPKLNVTYSTTEKTTDPVIATLELKEGIKVINNNGSNTYTFTKNGTFTFTYEDEYGNIGTSVATVNWIDTNELKVEVKYDITTPTNKNVIATLNANKKITITNNNGSNTYTFTESGTFTFTYEDEYGVSGSITAKVDWIDKVAPTAEVEYSTTEETTESVTAIIKPSEEVTITNNEGKLTYTFKENGEFTFEFVDKAGNKGTVTAKVDWIKEESDIPSEEPVLEIVYNNTEPTNQDVTVRIEFESGTIITNNNGSNTYIFTENGTFVFEYIDKFGRVGKKEITVDWIDKTEIVATITYDINSLTDKDVTATISANKEITILNNNGQATYIFTENGTFTFEYVDKYGNTGTATAKVDWINKTKPEDKPTQPEPPYQPDVKPSVPIEKPTDKNDKNESNKVDKKEENDTNKTDENKTDDNDENKPDEENKPEEKPSDNESKKDDEIPSNNTDNEEETASMKDIVTRVTIISLPIIIILYLLLIKKTNDKEEK